MASERSIRLHDRFKAIQESIAHTHGVPQSFAAGMAAELMLIENLFAEGLLRQRLDPEFNAELYQAEIHDLLKSLHKEICTYLKIDEEASLELCMHFNQVVRDICTRKG